MYGGDSINGSVEWLFVPCFGCDDGLPWNYNILVPIPRWGVEGTVETWSWVIQPSGRYGGVNVPWHGAVPARPDYLPRSPEMRAPLRAASVTISFRSTVWRAPKVSRIPGTSSVESCEIVRILSWMIFGMNQLLNNFCGGFPLIV